MGKEVPSSNSEYFRLDTEGGKTVLLIPSGGVDFTIDGFPYSKPPGLKEFQKSEIVSEGTVEQEIQQEKTVELKNYPYDKAHEQAVKSFQPLIVFAMTSDKHNKEVNQYIETLTSLGANKYFHFSALDKSNKDYESVVKQDHDLQVIVWWYINGKWKRRVYVDQSGVLELYQKIKSWAIDRKDNALMDIKIDFSAILFSEMHQHLVVWWKRTRTV